MNLSRHSNLGVLCMNSRDIRNRRSVWLFSTPSAKSNTVFCSVRILRQGDWISHKWTGLFRLIFPKMWRPMSIELAEPLVSVLREELWPLLRLQKKTLLPSLNLRRYRYRRLTRIHKNCTQLKIHWRRGAVRTNN